MDSENPHKQCSHYSPIIRKIEEFERSKQYERSNNVNYDLFWHRIMAPFVHTHTSQSGWIFEIDVRIWAEASDSSTDLA